MSKPYTEFRYLWPPRPENILSYDRLPYYEKLGWVAQYKKNGTCSLIWQSPDGEFRTMNRHNENHKAWQISKATMETLTGLWPKGKWTCCVAELLHNKAPGIKDTLYFHDVLVLNSEFLQGTTFMDRQKYLEELFPAQAEAYSHYVVTENIWRAKLLTTDLLGKFKSIQNQKVDEGLVIKLPTATLAICDSEKSNVGWQAKIRYPKEKQYAF